MWKEIATNILYLFGVIIVYILAVLMTTTWYAAFVRCHFREIRNHLRELARLENSLVKPLPDERKNCDN